MNKRIVNVIEMSDNSILGIDTFVIPETVTPHSKEEQEIVEQAEKLFESIATENGMEKGDLEACLEDGCFENDTYKVVISWSHENTEAKMKNIQSGKKYNKGK
jgi:hypothetical protein